MIAVIVHPSKLHSRVRTNNTLAADAFITNNSRDFDPALILGVRVVFPNDLGSLLTSDEQMP